MISLPTQIENENEELEIYMDLYIYILNLFIEVIDVLNWSWFVWIPLITENTVIK